MSKRAEDRFWSKVDKTPGLGPNGDCWEFTGSRMPKGYGRIGWGDLCENTSAAHVSLELDDRPRPSPDMISLHSCDHPPCVRPEHLSWGTDQQNVADRVERGRSARLLGETNPNAVLTEADVAFIRTSKLSGAQLHRVNGWAQSTISAVRNRHIWRHIP